jgi:hypothetical protein
MVTHEMQLTEHKIITKISEPTSGNTDRLGRGPGSHLELPGLTLDIETGHPD